MANKKKPVSKRNKRRTRDNIFSGQTCEQWLASHQEARLKIDQELAEFDRWYIQTFDPFGVWNGIPEDFW
jgi:hypothetical protein